MFKILDLVKRQALVERQADGHVVAAREARAREAGDDVAEAADLLLLLGCGCRF